MNPTRAWLVDLDGTLYHARPVKLRMALAVLFGGGAVIGVLRRFRKEHELLRHSLDRDVDSPFMEQVRRTAEAVGRPPSEVEAIVRDWMVGRPCGHLRRHARHDLLSEIAAFRDGGGKTGLVSDYPARDKLRALEADRLFDVVVANGEPDGPPRLKPHPAGYLRAAERLGVEPAECLVIGDRDDADGEAARAAGMRFRKV